MKKQKTIAVIGHFGFGLGMTDGQTIKTNYVARALEEHFPEYRILKKDTHGGLKTLMLLPFWTPFLLSRAEDIVILPAQRGVRIMAPLLTFWNRLFRRRLHYCIVGGWLPELLKDYPALAERLKRFSGLYAETQTMKRALEAMGFQNVLVVPNCKIFEPVDKNALRQHDDEPYRLCIFSRVMKEKGIEEAAGSVRRVNEAYGRVALTLDIYGPVDPAQTEWFAKLQETFPDYVRYCGAVPTEKSVETLRDYDALLFPTRFYTEGVPGTVIDAYAAGLPVIASRWESFGDIVDEGVTGIGYPFDDDGGLFDVLSGICRDPDRLMEMKANCVDRAARYLPENALTPFFQRIGV